MNRNTDCLFRSILMFSRGKERVHFSTKGCSESHPFCDNWMAVNQHENNSILICVLAGNYEDNLHIAPMFSFFLRIIKFCSDTSLSDL